MPRKKKLNTGDVSREGLGVGSILNTHHEGVTKRPTETRAGGHLDEVTAKDISKSTRIESPMNNPNFDKGEEGRR